MCGVKGWSLYSFMCRNVYSPCPYGNLKLCIDWFAMQRTFLKACCWGVKTMSKLQVAQCRVECINQPMARGEILFFPGSSCIKHFSKGILKTFRSMKRVFHSVFCCSKGICSLQNLILNTDMSHLTHIESFTHSWKPRRNPITRFHVLHPGAVQFVSASSRRMHLKGTTIHVHSQQAVKGSSCTLHLKHKLGWPQHVTLSFAHRITGCLRWECTSEDYLVQPTAQSRVTTSRLFRPHPFGFLISPRLETPQPPQQPMPGLSHLYSKKCSIIYKQNFPCFKLCPLPCPVTRNHREEPGSLYFSPSDEAFTHTDKTPLNLLFSRLDSPISLSLSLHDTCSSPFIICVILCWTLCGMSMSLLCWGAQNWSQHPRCASPMLSRGDGSPCSTGLELCLIQSRRLVACFAANMNILVSARTLLFCTAAFRVVGHNICWHMGLFFLYVQDFALNLAEQSDVSVSLSL